MTETESRTTQEAAVLLDRGRQNQVGIARVVAAVVADVEDGVDVERAVVEPQGSGGLFRDSVAVRLRTDAEVVRTVDIWRVRRIADGADLRPATGQVDGTRTGRRTVTVRRHAVVVAVVRHVSRQDESRAGGRLELERAGAGLRESARDHVQLRERQRRVRVGDAQHGGTIVRGIDGHARNRGVTAGVSERAEGKSDV